MSSAELDSFQAIPACQFNPASLTSNWQPVFPLSLAGSITAATNANPCQITSTAHGLVTGSVVQITNVGGMTELNDHSFVITRVDANNFTLNGINSTNYGVYTSGGNWVCYGGIADNIKIMTVFNGGTVAFDISYDGINFHALWPAGATLIVDFQSNHSCNPNFGQGTLNGRMGQNLWVRTSVNPTWLTVGGYR
jgi:hypothetical protein